MSLRTYSESAPFKITVCFGDDNKPTGFPSLDTYLSYLNHADDESAETEHEEKGWKSLPYEEYGELIVDVLKKGEKKVYFANEHEYANGGGLKASFFSQDKSALEALCDDWGFDKLLIQAGKTVQQTL